MFGLYGLQAQRAKMSRTDHDKYSSKGKLNKKQRKKMLEQQRNLRDRRRPPSVELNGAAGQEAALHQFPASCQPAGVRRGSSCPSQASSAPSDYLQVPRSRSPFTAFSCHGTPRQPRHSPGGGQQRQQEGEGEAGMVTASLESLARLFSCVSVSKARQHRRACNLHDMQGYVLLSLSAWLPEQRLSEASRAAGGQTVYSNCKVYTCVEMNILG
ncbi:uncharacterized protein LOC127009056 isoform X2 [Eriocheir sinensis]|uniref:uncharacterized protein LOC127009056 isoform X2 n=1 Tax=Eriocheir sinensis TaxID=95602 RepID=UPI0021C919EF|nr:uncharacterized protein LOC127009056 isoform X2 [Eriocheir sinensis]